MIIIGDFERHDLYPAIIGMPVNIFISFFLLILLFACIHLFIVLFIVFLFTPTYYIKNNSCVISNITIKCIQSQEIFNNWQSFLINWPLKYLSIRMFWISNYFWFKFVTFNTTLLFILKTNFGTPKRYGVRGELLVFPFLRLDEV